MTNWSVILWSDIMVSKKWNPAIKKQKILDACISVLNRKKISQCPVDVIAKTAGIAKGTIYLYFKNKEGKDKGGQAEKGKAWCIGGSKIKKG